jgi:hypothetical protein
MKITVEMRSVYGKDVIYPVCKDAKIFAVLVGQKTLTSTDIIHIKQLGYEVEITTSHPSKL